MDDVHICVQSENFLGGHLQNFFVHFFNVLTGNYRAGQWVTNFGTVGNRYDFEFSILLIETAWAGRIVFTRLTVYLIVNRISTNRVTISL